MFPATLPYPTLRRRVPRSDKRASSTPQALRPGTRTPKSARRTWGHEISDESTVNKTFLVSVCVRTVALFGGVV